MESVPVGGLPGSGTTIAIPESEQVLQAYLAETQKYVDGVLGDRVAQLQGQTQGGSNLAVMNKIAVLYAKCGQGDKAEAVLRQVLAQKAYLPSLLNLGNLYFQKADSRNALGCYQQASQLDRRARTR